MKDLTAVIIKVATSKSAIVIMNVKSYSESSRVLGSDVREGGKETQLPLFSLTACSKCKSLSSLLCPSSEHCICCSVAARRGKLIYLSAPH